MEIPRIEKLEAEIKSLENEIAKPEVSRDGLRLKQLSREHRQKKELSEIVSIWQRVSKEKKEAEDLLGSAEADMRLLAQEDLARLEKEEKIIREKIEELTQPRDPRNERDVILEIRAGTGGEEAALFAAELFRAYARHGERQGWKTHLVSKSLSEQGGMKEIIAEVSGRQVFGSLKFERGVHRVQRVPATEKQGRIHTSTVTVAVLPQAEEIELVIKPEDLRIDTYRASGAGGQHVNKTSSAVRITHLPTNTVVAVQDERSQHKNRAKAMNILRARLLEAEEEKKKRQEDSQRRAQVGTGDRSEKIRTYNYPQDRITDHRIKKSWGNIAGIMEGNWENIFRDLKAVGREN